MGHFCEWACFIDKQHMSGPAVCAAWLPLICFDTSIHLSVVAKLAGKYICEDAQSF